MVDICIFPIPECVTFPGTVFPLHVFEPRYRAMIQHCLDNQLPVAICHTRKMIHAAPIHQSSAEALQSNQATYQPFEIFSAGRCELVRSLPDGRLYLNVHLRQRYRMVAEKQTLPYRVFECEPFQDIEPDEDEQNLNRELQDKIVHRLQALAFRHPELEVGFAPDEWLAKDAHTFSFQLFGLVSFGADLQQEILEMNSIHQRLQRALELLNSIDY